MSLDYQPKHTKEQYQQPHNGNNAIVIIEVIVLLAIIVLLLLLSFPSKISTSAQSETDSSDSAASTILSNGFEIEFDGTPIVFDETAFSTLSSQGWVIRDASYDDGDSIPANNLETYAIYNDEKYGDSHYIYIWVTLSNLSASPIAPDEAVISGMHIGLSYAQDEEAPSAIIKGGAIIGNSLEEIIAVCGEPEHIYDIDSNGSHILIYSDDNGHVLALEVYDDGGLQSINYSTI